MVTTEGLPLGAKCEALQGLFLLPFHKINRLHKGVLCVHIQIGGRSETLYERDGAGLRLCAFQARLFGQNGRNGAVDHLQDRYPPVLQKHELLKTHYSLTRSQDLEISALRLKRKGTMPAT